MAEEALMTVMAVSTGSNIVYYSVRSIAGGALMYCWPTQLRSASQYDCMISVAGLVEALFVEWVRLALVGEAEAPH